MPILFMALMALAVFIGIGLMLFTATFLETRSRAKVVGAAVRSQQALPEEKPKARAAHA